MASKWIIANWWKRLRRVVCCWKSFSEALGGRKTPRTKDLCSVRQGLGREEFLFLMFLA